MKPFEVIEHTADAGIRAYGKDLRELFINAAAGMFSLITNITCVKPARKIDIDLVASDKEELIHNWLSELLYQHIFHHMLLCQFHIEEIDEQTVKGHAMGERIDDTKHELIKELKAVTYHGIRIEKQDNYLTTQIIFDV